MKLPLPDTVYRVTQSCKFKSPRREVVRSSTGAGVGNPPPRLFGVVRVAYSTLAWATTRWGCVSSWWAYASSQWACATMRWACATKRRALGCTPVLPCGCSFCAAVFLLHPGVALLLLPPRNSMSAVALVLQPSWC